MARLWNRPSRPVASRLAAAAVVAGALSLAVAGCASSGSPTASPTGSGTSTPTGSSSPRPTGTSTSAPIDGQCDAGTLTGSIQPGGGGAAGSVEVTLVLTNGGTAECSLQGWPGVSFVGDDDGTQLGAAAEFDRSTAHPTVTLQPGGTAQAPLKIVQALNYPESDCDPKQPDGFRVYPPGSTESLFIAYTNAMACESSSVSLLTVGALVPGA